MIKPEYPSDTSQEALATYQMQLNIWLNNFVVSSISVIAEGTPHGDRIETLRLKINEIIGKFSTDES